MLRDIVTLEGIDLGIAQSEAPRAANILQTQLGDLSFAPDLGVDLRYFLQSEFRIQNASFKAYLVQRLLEQKINVVNVISTISSLYETYTVGVGASEESEGLIS